MKTTQIVRCSVPGLEEVQVEYNMMASVEACNTFAQSMAVRCFDDVIVSVHGWPEETYPGGPQGDAAPMAWRIWLVRIGFVEASRLYATDPN